MAIPLMGIGTNSEPTLLRKGTKRARLLEHGNGSRSGSSSLASSTDSETTCFPEVSDFDEGADASSPEDQRTAWDLPTANIINLNITHHHLAAAGYTQESSEIHLSTPPAEARRGNWEPPLELLSSSSSSSSSLTVDRPRLR